MYGSQNLPPLKIISLAAVSPVLDNSFIKRLECKVYQFIWNGSDSVKRDDAEKLEKQGGLNMPDILASWKAFKMAWFRRLLKTEASWGKIFDLNLQHVYNNMHRNDNIFLGTQSLLHLSKSFPLKFWSKCFTSLKEFSLLYLTTHPWIFSSIIWNNHVFIRNKALCGMVTFRSIYNKVKYPTAIITNREGKTRFLS